MKLPTPLIAFVLATVVANQGHSQIIQPITLNARLSRGPSINAANHGVKINIINEAPIAYNIVWIDLQGQPSPMGTVAPRQTFPLDTTPGHIFNIVRANRTIDGTIQANVSPVQNYRISDPARPPKFVPLPLNEDLLELESLNISNAQVVVHVLNSGFQKREIVRVDHRGRTTGAGWIDPGTVGSFFASPGHLIEIEKPGGDIVANFRVGAAAEQHYSVDNAILTGPNRSRPMGLNVRLINQASAPALKIENATLIIDNNTPDLLSVYRNDHRGAAELMGTIAAGDDIVFNTTQGIIFNVRNGKTPVANLQVGDDLIHYYHVGGPNPVPPRPIGIPVPVPTPIPDPVKPPKLTGELLHLDALLLNKPSPEDPRDRKVAVKITNNTKDPLSVYWNDLTGRAQSLGSIPPKQSSEITSAPGYIYTLRNGKLPVATLQVNEKPNQSYLVGK